MSIKVMTDIWEHSKLSGTPLLLVLALADHANDERKCWPATKSLAHKARISQRHAQRLLRRLEHEGHLRILTGEGPHGCNIYAIPTAAEMAILSDLGPDREWDATGDTPDTSDTGMTLVSQGDDTSVAQGVTLVSPESSITVKESSIAAPAKKPAPHGGKPPSGGGHRTPNKPNGLSHEQTETRNRMVYTFSSITGQQCDPQKIGYGARNKRWHQPMQEIATLVEWDEEEAVSLVRETIETMIDERLRIKDPGSLVTVAQNIVLHRKNAAAPEQVAATTNWQRMG
jgi:hypothetical protein